MMILIVLSIIISVIAWIGFAKYYRYKRNESWFASIFVGCVFSCLILFICIAFSLLALSCIEPSSPPTPTKSDKELYFSFYNDITSRAREFDNKIKPFLDAVSAEDPLKAINIASDIKDEINDLWYKIETVDIPELKNKEAQDELKKAKVLLSTAYMNRSQALKDFVEYSKNPSPYTMAKVTKNKDIIQDQLILGSAALITAGGKLGLSIDEIEKGEIIPVFSSMWERGSQYYGAVKNIQLQGSENKDNNGQYYFYTVINDINVTQIKPTLLASFEGLSDKFPQYKNITVSLYKNDNDVKYKKYIAKIDGDQEKLILTINDQQEFIKIKK